MNTFALWLANRLARTLEPEERDAILGDQQELGLSGARAVRDALGLVVRRQYQLSTADESGLGPWWRLVPLFAVLISHSVKLGRALDTASFPSQLLFLAGLGVTVGVLSWTIGFLLGSFSGRARSTNSVLLVAGWLIYFGYHSGRFELGVAGLTVHALLFVIPVVAGFRSGAAQGRLSTRKATIVAAVPPLIFLSLVILVARGDVRGGPLAWVVSAFLALAFIGSVLPGCLLVILSRIPPRRDEAAP